MMQRFRLRTPLTATALAAVCVLSAAPFAARSEAQSSQAPSMAELIAGFAHPPAAARPMVRWWWFGAAVEKPEILRELQQMKADGIGGAELAFVYLEVLDDPAKGLKNLPFLSPGMLDAVNYAQSEARKLGLRIDITLCSGWPYGGPATTLAEAATRLRTAELAVPPNATTVSTPKLEAGETLISAALADGTPNPPPVRRGPASGPPSAPPPNTWDAASAKPFSPTGDASSIAPEGRARVALFFIQSHTRQEVKRAAVGAEGYVLDPFSHQAVATHLKAVGEPLLSAFGSTPPYAIFSDSLEAYGADWTPTLPEEFRRRRGYDLIPHLPELVAGGSPEAEKIRHDYGRTLTELVNENYLTQINDWAKAHHTKFRSQTYGEPAVSFSSQRLASLPEGEGPQWRAFSTLRWATSANHVFGNNVTSGETFTWLHSPVFRATPLDMKAEADIDFIMGENQLIFHGWPYSAPPGKVPEPGWSLYAAASFNEHNPWHPVMPAIDDYIARISYLLRQGEPANQVAILLPTDDAWAGFSPGRSGQVSITGAMQRLMPREIIAAILSAGYNVDFIDADAINSVGLGTHQILVIPPTDRIPVETLRKIAEFKQRGGKVIGIGHAPSLNPESKPLANISGDGSSPLLHSSGAILLPDDSQLADALHRLAPPDLNLTAADPTTRNAIGFIRRTLAGQDIYFVVNTGNQTLHTSATFATTHPYGYDLVPETGELRAHADLSARGVKLDLAPYESRVFLFDHSSKLRPDAGPRQEPAPRNLSADWKVTFTSTGKSSLEPTLTDWTADPATLHYSGEAVYSRDFDFTPAQGYTFLMIDGGKPLPGAPTSPPEHPVLGSNGLPNPLITGTGPGMHAYFDPPIHEAALVTINGQPAGALWHPPYRLDITKLLKPGQNHIEIHVFNTALNAWSALPPHDYKPLIAKYGDRFQMQDLDKVQPIPSGILGTIRLVTEEPK